MSETTQSKRPLLPSLKKGKDGKSGHNVQPPDVGQWDARKAEELDKISEGLDVNQAETQVNSIPDVWARPLLFEMALFSSDKDDKKHPLREQILGEWRGLLAMLALKEIKNLKILTAKKVEIKLKDKKSDSNPNNQNVEDKSNDEEKNPVFLEILHKLIPKKTITEDTSWNHLYLFLFQIGHHTRPIGLASPTTLIATPTHYFNHIDQNKIPWFDGKILQDPINYLSKIEKEALAGWLNSINKSLTVHSGQKDMTILNKISGLLQSFISDLNAAVNFSEGTTSFGIEKGSGIFYYLDKPAGAPQNTGSDVSLVTSENRKPQMPMLLVDRQIAVDWDKPLKDITVSGSVTLADLSANDVITRHQIGSHTISNAQMWQPKELFTEKLYVVKSDNAFSGARPESWVKDEKAKLNNQPVSVILPINEELLEYLDEDDLLQRLKFQQGTNGEITVQLRLTLGMNTQRLFEVKKTYSRNEIFDYDQVPVIEVFPNFKRDNWKAYYVAYSADNPKNTFQAKPRASNSEKVKIAGTDKEEWNWRFDSAVEEAKIPIASNADGERLIWRLESFPNVLICSAKDADGNNQKAGLLLLEPSQKILPAANRIFTAGVDFGASGTSVYKSSGSTKEPLKFENLKLSVTSLTPYQELSLYQFFFPPRSYEIPLLSIFQDFNSRTAGNYLPVTNGHIYYVEDKQLPEKNIFTDLKWSDEANHNLYAESFLTQLCLQTVAELVQDGVTAIDWKFSYPTAFSKNRLGSFKPIWERIVKNTSEMTGVKSNGLSNLTESVAAARFFRDDTRVDAHKAQISLGTVFVDIGSSTSDISVWQGNELLWQVSLLYAGRDILLDYFYRNQNILDDLGLSLTSSEHFYAQIDAILRKDSEQIFSNLLGKDLKELKKHLALGLSGLFYYIGLGISCLRQKNIYEKAEMPHFYFGGNGSQIFRWLINGQHWDNNSDLARLFAPLFETVFTKALGENLNGFFKLVMSNLPKREAAFGLVCNTDLSEVGKCKDVFAGEKYIENKTEYDWSHVLDEEGLTDSLEPPEKLNKLAEFIEEFNDFAVKSEGLVQKFDCDARKLSDVRGQLGNSLNDLSKLRAKNEGVVVQPIFILALKHLLKS